MLNEWEAGFKYFPGSHRGNTCEIEFDKKGFKIDTDDSGMVLIM